MESYKLNSLIGSYSFTPSSRRGKENIQDMDEESIFLYSLRPVIFNYISDRTKSVHYGLIAEEVEELAQTLVAYDEEGKPEGVKYYDLPILLLNELQKLHNRVEELEKQLK